MKPVKMGLAWAAGLAAGALAWAAGSSPSPDSYSKIDAASLVNSPQSSWARAILFSDVMEQVPAGRPERLDRKNFLPMKLKTAGTVWVPEALAAKFQVLKMGDTYSFAGTVDQISRRYYVIVDACYTVQTAENMSERWTDMLNPPAQSEASARADVSETAMQALLLEAQNSLIKLAAENKTTVAQLIEKQTDGGQRIAEEIVLNQKTTGAANDIERASAIARRMVCEWGMSEAFGLTAIASHATDELPLGFKQRLALACSLMHEPDILFLDEPTSGVDPLTRREFWLHINSMVEKGVTVMVTTHFMDEAEYCDRIGLVYRGKLIASGTPDDLKALAADDEQPDPTMEQAFITLIHDWDKENAGEQ